MAYTYNRTSKDANHNEIEEAIRSAGGAVFDTTCVKEFCDIVAIYEGVVYLIEIKDGSKPPSQRQLTPRERKALKRAQKAKGNIYVINSPEEAISLITG